LYKKLKYNVKATLGENLRIDWIDFEALTLNENWKRQAVFNSFVP
jgi:hypothetical protein